MLGSAGLLPLAGRAQQRPMIASAKATRIKVICPPGLQQVMQELSSQFRQETGHTPAITYVLSHPAKKRIAAGETFDLAILLSAVSDEIANEGKIVLATAIEVMRAGMGVAVREGMPKPNIDRVQTFKRALLDAESITYTREAATGRYFEGLMERLELGDEVKKKVVLAMPATSAKLVAAGKAAMAITLIAEILAAPGAELVGPFPAELQYYIAFKAGVASRAEQREAAGEFIKFLTGPAAARTIRNLGVEPG